MLISTYLSVFALALSLLLSTAQPGSLADALGLSQQNSRFKRIDSEQGLVNGRVLSILQDRQGFVWFGTAEGLDRYDGQDFVHNQTDFDDKGTLSNDVVWRLYEDHAGYIWVGTAAGLNRYDPASESFTRFEHRADDPTSLGGDTVGAIYQDRQGVLWVGTGQGGLDRFDPQTNSFTHYKNDPNNPQSLSHNDVTGIAEDRAGNLWVSTYGGGLNQLIPGENPGDPPAFLRFQNDPDNPQSMSKDQIQDLYFDSHGFLWLATWGGGLDRFDPISKSFTHYQARPNDPSSLSNDTIAAIAEDPQGNIWAGTWGGGLNRLDRAGNTFTQLRNNPADPATLSQDSVRSLYITKDGILFAGTAGAGVNQLDLRPNPFRYLNTSGDSTNSPAQDDMRAILQDREGKLWLGTQSAGLDSFDPDTQLFTHYRNDPRNPKAPGSLSNNTVWTVFEDRDSNIWVGTQGGLDKIERASGQVVHYQNDPTNPNTLSSGEIYAITQDPFGDLWVGTVEGLNKLDLQTGTFTRYLNNPDDSTSLSNNSIGDLYIDNTGVLWVGTQGGLNRMDIQNGTFTRYQHDPDNPSTISNNTVALIVGDTSGMLWLGTYGGLNRFDPRSGQALHFTTQDGLRSNVIWSILPDDQGNLWLGTPNGLDRLDPRTHAVRSYGLSDGLFLSGFNARAIAKSSADELMVGSTKGMVLFDPAELREHTQTSPLVMTGFELANRPVQIGPDSVLQQSINKTGTLNLSYLDRVISFAFTALDFRAPQDIHYRYTLKGFDTRWSEVDSKRRFVTYTNLEPGGYTFQVQNTDSNGDWIAPGRSISLLIVPPWWQTTWFRLSLAGLLVLGIAGAYGFRVRMLQQRNRDLEEQVSRRTTSLQGVNTELEQRIGEISTLNQIGHVLSRAAPLEAMLEELVPVVTTLFHSAGTTICLPSADRSNLNIIEHHRIGTPPSAYSTNGAKDFQIASASILMQQALPLYTLFPEGKSVILDNSQANWAASYLWPNRQKSSFQDASFNGAALKDSTLEDSTRRDATQKDAIYPDPRYPQAMFIPIIVRGEVNGVLILARSNPSDFFSASEATLAETIANQVAAAYENNRLFEEEHRQRSVAEMRSTELSTLLTISHDVSSMLDLEPLLNLILYHLAQVVDFSTILILELTGEELGILAQHGVMPSALSEVDEFPVAWFEEETPLFRDRKPLIWGDLAKEPMVREGMRKTFGSKLAYVLQETHSCMVVPMVTRDTIVGLFWFGHKQLNHYSNSQAEYISAVVQQAAIAIENAHDYQEMQTAAADQERNRIAQELHDSVSQSLLAAIKAAEVLPALWEQSPERGRYALDLLQRLMQQELAEMRTLMLELRPSILAQKPLGEILRQLVDSFAGRSQLPVHLQVNGDTILPAICQVTFYRTAQAALDNIHQHADAGQVNIELTCTPRFVEMWIADDGKGFDPTMVPLDRMGLNIMRERAEKIGATYQLDSEPGKGTRVTVHYDRPIG